MWYHQTSTETFVISMLPQDGDWRFRCESDHAKRFEKLCLQAFGSHAQMKQWDGLVNWLSFCMAVLGLSGFWAQTLKEFNMFQLKKDSMQSQHVSTWSQNESRPKTSKSMMEIWINKRICRISHTFKTSAKALNSTERNLMHWIPLRFPDMLQQLTQAGRVCFLCHSATSSNLRREFEIGLVKRRKYQGQFCYCIATVSYSILVCALQLVAPAWFLETHRSLEFHNEYLTKVTKVCWCKGRADNQANKIVEDHALLLPPQLM